MAAVQLLFSERNRFKGTPTRLSDHSLEGAEMHVWLTGGETGQEGSAGPVNAGSVHPNDRSLQKACLERCNSIDVVVYTAFIRAFLVLGRLSGRQGYLSCCDEAGHHDSSQLLQSCLL